MRKRAFFVESNGEEPSCTICGSSLRYRDKVSRIMKRYNGEKAHVMIERRKCQNPDCKKLHRCLPSQLTRFKHFMTEGDDIITSPTIRTVAGWKAWVRHNTPNINGCLKAVGHGILGLSTQFLKSGISLLDELREDGGGWLATIQQVIYNSGGSIEPFY